MKIFYWRGPRPNFGDELNLWLWPRVWPELKWEPAPSDLYEDPHDWAGHTLLVGIGTLLTRLLPAAARKVIFGAGTRPDRIAHPDQSWEIWSVRGPLTVDALGLDPALAVTDAAALAAAAEPPERAQRYECSYMPHLFWDSPEMARACEDEDVHYISPCGDTEDILAQIRATRVMICGAMHGAILADTFRVPWIPVMTHKLDSRFKWEDWCASLELDYRPEKLTQVWPSAGMPSLTARVKAKLRHHMAERDLARLRRAGVPRLSSDRVFSARLDRLRQVLDALKEAYTNAA